MINFVSLTIPPNFLIIFWIAYNVLILILRTLYELLNAKLLKKKKNFSIIFIFMTMIGIIVLFIPVYIQSVYYLPINYGMKPEIIAPGDKVVYSFPIKFPTLNGHWKAKENSIKIKYKQNKNCPGDILPIITPIEKPWGFIILTKVRKPPNMNALFAMNIPDNECFNNQDIIISFNCEINYPVLKDSEMFNEESFPIQSDIPIKFSSKHTKAQYQFYLNLSLWLSNILLIIAGFSLASLDKSKIQ